MKNNPRYEKQIHPISLSMQQKVYDKCCGHCVYCGAVISLKGMHVDHYFPLALRYTAKEIKSKWNEKFYFKTIEKDGGSLYTETNFQGVVSK